MLDEPKHPGRYVRETYLNPRGINVTEAAKLIGISRPGVSSFLNGRVSTTEHMASRIEVAFGVPKEKLLRMQAEYDAGLSSQAVATATATPYVPPFLGIKANEIIGWVDHNVPARTRLSVFLRTLINSTTLTLERIDFPGNDDAERPGWDGLTETSNPTAWVPAGVTGWEFGVNDDPRKKADGDFAKSVNATERADRVNTTFVFVTPRRWPGKVAWVASMRAAKQWKDVRAYDASDLEQWLEQSPAAQAWFAGETSRASQGVKSLDLSWFEWANVSTPPMSAELFNTAKGVAVPRLKSFLERPAGRPLVIAADSVEEALALLAQAFSTPELLAARDRVLVFGNPGALPKLAQGMHDFIAVIHTRDVERELGPFANKIRSIVIYPRNATNEDPDVTLEPLGFEAFRAGLETMGFNRDDITTYGHESGHSLTVLRRRLSKVEAVRMPKWASDPDIAAGLIPIMLAGAWNESSPADQMLVSWLAGEDVKYEEIERRMVELLRLNDTPVWSVGNYRGVISKIDALFAIARLMTLKDLRRYLELAKLVLGEDDPALDLPEKDRWWAELQGKRRESSETVRSGISETLVLLSVHGKHLFKLIGFDGKAEAEKLIRELLLPLDIRKLESTRRELPTYAEAAPETFLKIFEDDLKTVNPVVLGLLRPVDTENFGAQAIRVDLLWSLEGLAWNPATFRRAVSILAWLAEIEIADNWGNKPIASLQSIFRNWMPQTAASHEDRVQAVVMMLTKFPKVGWQVCLDQFGKYNDTGDYTHKPKWRGDGYGAGEPFEFEGPAHAFQKDMVDLALSRPTYTVSMLCDLVERLHGLGQEYQDMVWKIIDTWLSAKPLDSDMATVREKVRVTVLSRRARRTREAGDFASLTATAQKTYTALEPEGLVHRYEWLFRQQWVEESADEISEPDRDFRKRDERVQLQRIDAIKAIFAGRGKKGIFELAAMGMAQGTIGLYVVRDVLPNDQIASFILEALQPGANDLSSERKNLVFGALRGLAQDDCEAFLLEAQQKLPDADMLRLLLLAPYRQSSWRIVDKATRSLQDSYWSNVHPDWIWDPEEEENNESIERLLKAKRPRAAFQAVNFRLERIRPLLLVELLQAIAQKGDDKDGEYRLTDQQVREGFSLLDANPDVPFDQKALLEFTYVEVLGDRRGRGVSHIRNLERYIEMHPELWVQALVWAFKRKNRGDDPEGFRRPEGREDLSMKGHRILDTLSRIPGTNEDGKIDQGKLWAWVESVRTTSAELDRLNICDIHLGQLFVHAPEGEDGVWPCEPVRNVMENIQTEALFRGAHTGLRNSRGAHWRGEGGDQEREIAEKYQRWGDALQFTHPQLSAGLLVYTAKSYEQDAEHEDTEAGIRKRLRH